MLGSRTLVSNFLVGLHVKRLFAPGTEIEVASAEPQADFSTVVRGDSLSKTAKRYCGNAMKYPVIFEADQPMLSHPDEIYPGQVLRIPPRN